MAFPKRKRCIDDSDSEPDEATPSKRRVPLPPPPVSSSSIKDALTDPKDTIAVLTPALQTKLLEKLLADPSTSQAAARTLTSMYPDAVPALAADIRARLASGLAPVKARAAKGDGVDLSDYVAAAQPLLEDVIRLARVPHPGAARAAYTVLLELVFATDPPEEEDCTIDAPEERIPFDKVADEMLLAIAEKRKAEEGAGFVVGSELDELKSKAACFGWELQMEAWFAKSIAFLEVCAAAKA